MSDIFREVEEDLRRERLNAFWRRYGFVVVGVAVAIVAGVAGWRGYEAWSASRAAWSGDRFTAAVDLAETGKRAEAVAALSNIVAEGSGRYPLLARFRTAAEKAKDGDKAAAAAAFDAIADEGDAPQVLRDLAKVRAAYLLVDASPREEIARRVESLAKAGDPWRHSARELLGLSAFKAQDSAAAERWFTEAAQDGEAPQGIRSRADLFLALIAGARSAP